MFTFFRDSKRRLTGCTNWIFFYLAKKYNNFVNKNGDLVFVMRRIRAIIIIIYYKHQLKNEILSFFHQFTGSTIDSGIILLTGKRKCVQRSRKKAI